MARKSVGGNRIGSGSIEHAKYVQHNINKEKNKETTEALLPGSGKFLKYSLLNTEEGIQTLKSIIGYRGPLRVIENNQPSKLSIAQSERLAKYLEENFLSSNNKGKRIRTSEVDLRKIKNMENLALDLDLLFEEILNQQLIYKLSSDNNIDINKSDIHMLGIGDKKKYGYDCLIKDLHDPDDLGLFLICENTKDTGGSDKIDDTFKEKYGLSKQTPILSFEFNQETLKEARRVFKKNFKDIVYLESISEGKNETLIDEMYQLQQFDIKKAG